jgi:hypothetical protein
MRRSKHARQGVFSHQGLRKASAANPANTGLAGSAGMAAPPQTFFDGGNAVKDLTSREAFDDLDNLGRAIARHRLHQKMDVIFVSANL